MNEINKNDNEFCELTINEHKVLVSLKTLNLNQDIDLIMAEIDKIYRNLIINSKDIFTNNKCKIPICLLNSEREA